MVYQKQEVVLTAVTWRTRQVPAGKGGAARWGHRPQQAQEDRAGAGGEAVYFDPRPLLTDYMLTDYDYSS